MSLATAPDVSRRLYQTGGREHAGLLRRRVTIKEGGSTAKTHRPTTPRAFPPDSDRTTRASRATTSRTFLSIDRAICGCFVIYVMNFDERGKTRSICTTLCELLIDEWRSLEDNDGSEELLEQKSEDIMALLLRCAVR